MSEQRKANGKPANKQLFGALAVGLAGLAALTFVWYLKRGETAPGLTVLNQDSKSFASYAKSGTCQSCHEEVFRLWETSHHALAERPVSSALDSRAFEPAAKISHGSQGSEARLRNQHFEVSTIGTNGELQPFRIERVLGVDPLRQFLIPAAGGRFQATELAFAPRSSDWFDVYGTEDRRAGEWGHWTGRGMTWNSMCAACHNTGLKKNYQPTTDSYATRMAERGVGCEACHGTMADHNAYQLRLKETKSKSDLSRDPTVHRIGREAMFAVCGSCHARRAELTGDFQPGANFFDHFALTIPDETDVFYPDGQVHEEDYEFTSFLSSRMHAAGVRCIDCHEPHSGKTRIPGNNLCLVCHAAPAPPAPKIDLATHSHHKTGEWGDQCVDCHMPQTVYMQRHARHDHGFTIPDPLLTKQFQIPNACNRCHAERTADWSLDAVQKWYGKRMERPSRERAKIIARARAGEPKSATELTELLRCETNSFWRAVSANLLKRWTSDKQVAATLLPNTTDPNPLVRAMSVRALEPSVQSGDAENRAALNKRLEDDVRSVRLDAAWALRASLDTNSNAGRDLLRYLSHNADEPGGELQLGIFWMDRGDIKEAMNCFERAVKWDPNSAPLHDAMAIGLSLQGQTEIAVQELQTACRLAPRDAELRFKLGLALSEAGKSDAARVALQEAVRLEPSFARAWYNLGLADNAAGKTDSALESLSRAESLDASSAQIPYARATILARLGRAEEARTAARRALEIQPGYSEAESLLQSLAPRQ